MEQLGILHTGGESPGADRRLRKEGNSEDPGFTNQNLGHPREEEDREAELHARESHEPEAGEASERLAVEQLGILHAGGESPGADRRLRKEGNSEDPGFTNQNLGRPPGWGKSWCRSTFEKRRKQRRPRFYKPKPGPPALFLFLARATRPSSSSNVRVLRRLGQGGAKSSHSCVRPLVS